MKKLFLFLLISIFLISSVSATWYCGGINWNDCPSVARYECCKSGIPFCLPTSTACEQFCCTGGCNDMNDFSFCLRGEIANCNVITSFPNQMACCPPTYPVWSNEAQVCFKIGWECVNDGNCGYNEKCENNLCVIDPCSSVTCEDKCQDSIKYYNGYCLDGECQYKTETCDFGCSGSLCKQDPCLGVICNDYCVDSIFYSEGECNPSIGTCNYVEQSCDFGCKDDKCASDPCVGLVCVDYCSDEGNTLYYEGKCINGECTNFLEKPYAEECGFSKPPVPILTPIAKFFSGIWDWIKWFFGG